MPASHPVLPPFDVLMQRRLVERDEFSVYASRPAKAAEEASVWHRSAAEEASVFTSSFEARVHRARVALSASADGRGVGVALRCPLGAGRVQPERGALPLTTPKSWTNRPLCAPPGVVQRRRRFRPAHISPGPVHGGSGTSRATRVTRACCCLEGLTQPTTAHPSSSMTSRSSLGSRAHI